jgi:hypothetical protein
MAIDYSRAAIEELEARVREAGDCLLAGDEGGDGSKVTHWCEVIESAMMELLRRGHQGQAIVTRLFDDANLEVRLSAACVALQEGLAVVGAKQTLQELSKTRGGSGWPAHYARKVLSRYP